MTLVNPSLGDSVTIEAEVKPKEMLSVSQTDDGKTLVRINSSSLSIIQECMRKAKYYLDDGWRAQDNAPGLVFGSAFHQALEVFYSVPVKDRHLPKLNDMLGWSYGHWPESHDSMQIVARAFVDAAQPLSPLPETDKRSIQNGIWILWNYIKTYLDDPYVTYEDKDGLFLERTFSLQVCDTDTLKIELFGTIDFALRHTKTGEILVGDHKTSSFLQFKDSSYFDREKPNHQYTAYMWGARAVFGLDVKDFMVNVIEVKARPKTEKGQPPSFPRQITSRTEEDFAELQEVLIYYVTRYLEAREKNIWPMGPVGSCTAYGSCTYKKVCAAPKSLRENILNAQFNRSNSCV